jgi:endonuclease/exonuclease/phosphatase family metal-dependent hydrolase
MAKLITIAIRMAFVITLTLMIGASGCPKTNDSASSSSAAAKTKRGGKAHFCNWNVENLFDDQDDPNNSDDIENWYANNPEMFRQKIDKIVEGLLRMNDGIGPDIACLCEVETMRCFEVLMDAINAKLAAKGFSHKKYESILFKGDITGRRFSPGILTRLPVIADRTRKPGNRYNGRILEGHIEVNGHELTILTGHWTSRVTDKEHDGDRRMSYANDTYGRVRAILEQDPDADILVSGDFNDEFEDKSLQEGLRVSKSFDTVFESFKEPRLLALFHEPGTDPPGTIYGRGRWSTFDHICGTRGLLDKKGWSLDLRSARVFAPKEFREPKTGAPFKFDDEKHTGPRGFSDHFPVVATLLYEGER